MFEKVNPKHPDKIADRIAGAMVDLAYKIDENPKIAVEVLIGHGECFILVEADVQVDKKDIRAAVERIAGADMLTHVNYVAQDKHLSDNQKGKVRCGDNGIFKGTPTSEEELKLASIASKIYQTYDSDGKYILDSNHLTICQSNASSDELKKEYKNALVNPLGDWTGGTDVDAGATNRKLGSDMGRAVTGGGLHGKDLSKADVSVNIYAFLKAQELNQELELSCAIGDETIDGTPYKDIVDTARGFIDAVGGFEKFAEWGLLSPN